MVNNYSPTRSQLVSVIITVFILVVTVSHDPPRNTAVVRAHLFCKLTARFGNYIQVSSKFSWKFFEMLANPKLRTNQNR